ncbi:RCC1 domain-containing protein [Pseudomonas sp. GB2N2]
MSNKSKGALQQKPDRDLGQILVMGARGCNRAIGAFHPSSWRLVALDADTLQPIVVSWQYKNGGRPVLGNDFFDTQPDQHLIVSSGTERVTLNPLNISGNFPAMCALRDDKTLHAWGWDEFGGELPEEIRQIKDAEQIESSMAAFAVRRANGSVQAWGSPLNPSSFVPPDIAALTNIVGVFGGNHVFVALLTTGQVVAWGLEDAGGKLPDRIAALTDVVGVVGTQYAVAVLRRTGQVDAWGDPDNGGELSEDVRQLRDVVQIAHCGRNFAVRRANGKLAVWGSRTGLPPIPPDIADLQDVVGIEGRSGALAVRRANGQVKAWGSTPRDTPPKDIADLFDIVDVRSTSYSFIALRATGQVVAWGDGMTSVVPDAIARLSDIVAITTNHEAAAVLRSNGEAIAFGDPATGGDNLDVAHLLTNVRAVYGGTFTFTALRADRRVISWGDPQRGGTGEQKALYGLISYAGKSEL